MEAIYKDAIELHATELARSIDDPAAIAARLGEWAKENLPERIASALWITAKGEKDKGIEIRLHELTLGDRVRLRFGAALGAWSAGLTGTVPIHRTSSGTTVSVGLGAVVRYTDLEDVAPVAVLTVRF
jgi:hypothetical protein